MPLLELYQYLGLIICLLFSFLLTGLFINENKVICFFIINWFVFNIISFIFARYFYEDVWCSYDFSEEVMYTISGFAFLILEPVHHILFIVALVWLIVRWYKKRKNNIR